MDAVVIRDVTKTYRLRVGRARVREMLPSPFDRVVQRLLPKWWAKDTFHALEEVSLSVPGESSLGIVGHNGAGKTTLLKVIAGVTEPSAGTAHTAGRVAALLDALVGFHPDLTGEENVYLLGSMHGFGRKIMAARIKQILAFAELEEAFDTPVKRYSAGMAARLGFATITALDVEILLIDEILAVGDAAFQRKCIDWLDEFRSRGGTLLFVSHNLGLIRSMTDKVVWLDHGRIVSQGQTDKILGDYVRSMEHRDFNQPMGSRRDVHKTMAARGLHRWGAGGARVENVHVEEPSGNGSGLVVAIDYEAENVEQALFSVGFVDEGDREIGSAVSPPVHIDGGAGLMRCVIHPLPLRSGIYFPVVAILSPDGLVRDSWRLDRAVVVERSGELELADTFGRVEIEGSWAAD